MSYISNMSFFQAGVNAGDGVTFYTVDGAMTEAILDVASTTNVGILGRWMFPLFNFTTQCFEESE